MAHIRFASHLKQFFPKLCALEIDAATVAEVLRKLETIHPGLSSYLVDEHGAMRKHVSIYIGNELIHDRDKLTDTVQPQDEIFFFQALSGG